MSINPVSPAITALASLSGTVPTVASAAGAGARSVAMRVISEIAESFRFAPDRPAGAANPRAYELPELADALGRAMAATPLETVEMEHALESLAGAVAADMVALADGRTLDRLDGALAALGSDGTPATAARVASRIEQIAAHIAAAS